MQDEKMSSSTEGKQNVHVQTFGPLLDAHTELHINVCDVLVLSDSFVLVLILQQRRGSLQKGCGGSSLAMTTSTARVGFSRKQMEQKREVHEFWLGQDGIGCPQTPD